MKLTLLLLCFGAPLVHVWWLLVSEAYEDIEQHWESKR